MTNNAVVGTELHERLVRLLRRVGKIQRDLRAPGDRDWQERASELENDDVLEGLDEMSRVEVQEIREALRRIEMGKYGTCSACGRPISAARLTAVPTAVNCVGCATRSSLNPNWPPP